MADRAVRVITEIAAVDRGFDYLISNDVTAGIGDRVRVNLHGRSVRGWIVGDGDTDRDLKPITKWLGLGPPASMVDLAHWCAQRWNGPVARFLDAASPARIVTALPSAPTPPALATSSVATIAPGVVRLAPAVDPLDIVLSAYEQTRGASGSLVVLVPTEGWAERLTERLKRRGLIVASASDWERARAGWPIVVGSRGAAFAPVPKIAGAIVIDADDESYRSSAAPTWRSLDVLIRRCEQEGSPWWATSPLPSPWLSSLARVSSGPDEIAMWPAVDVVDRRSSDPRDGVLSESAMSLCHAALASDEPVAVCVVLQRLGRGRLFACANCGELARCPTCGRAESEVEGRLMCESDGCSRESFCSHCGSTKLKAIRSGVTTLARDVSNQLSREVTEITSQSSSVGPLARVVVGTEAVFTRVRRARVVVFVDIDQYLLAPRERGRRDAVLAVAKAGRMVGGRREGRGRIVVQTRRGDDPVLRALTAASFTVVSRQDDDDARLLGHAPYRSHADVSGPGAVAFVASLGELGLTIESVEDHFIVSADSTEELTSSLARVERPPEAVRVAVE